MEIPEKYCHLIDDSECDFSLESQKKGYKRYYTEETKVSWLVVKAKSKLTCGSLNICVDLPWHIFSLNPQHRVEMDTPIH